MNYLSEDKSRILLSTLEAIDNGISMRQALVTILGHVNCGRMEAGTIERDFEKQILEKKKK
jgi:hypothetical protein